MPTIFCMPLQIFRPSHGPNLVTYDILHQFFCTSVSLKSSIQRHMIQNHVIHVVRNSSLHMWIFGYNRHSFLLKNLYKLISMKNESKLCSFQRWYQKYGISRSGVRGGQCQIHGGNIELIGHLTSSLLCKYSRGFMVC